MASLIRLVPLRAIRPVVLTARCRASTVTSRPTGGNLTKSTCFPSVTKQKLLAPTVDLTHGQVRFMSADPDCQQEVEERLLTVLNLCDKINPETLTLGSHFIKDLGLDSLDHVEIIVAVENEFAFEISDAEAELLMTPEEIIAFICDYYDIDE